MYFPYSVNTFGKLSEHNQSGFYKLMIIFLHVFYILWQGWLYWIWATKTAEWTDEDEVNGSFEVKGEEDP